MPPGSQRPGYLLLFGLLGMLLLLTAAADVGTGDRGQARDQAGDLPQVRGATGLEVAQAQDTTHLPATGSADYRAANLTDGAFSTAWAVGAGTDPSGARAHLTLPEAAVIQRVEIANGYQKSPRTFARNGRVRYLLLAFDDGTSASLALEDADGWQLRDIPDVTTASVALKIVEVYPGTDRALGSAALSEVRLLGRPAPPE